MLNYVTVGSNQLAKAKEFYDAVFGAVGFRRAIELKAGGTAYCVSYPEQVEPSIFCVLEPENGQPATFGNGVTVGFKLRTYQEVDRMFAKAIEMGGTSEGDPGLREINIQGTYIAYMRDLDGNKLAISTIVDEETARSGVLRKVY